MAFNFTFDNMSRIGSDMSYQDQNTLQNTQAFNYNLQNYFADDCSMRKTIGLATSQPGIMFNGGSSGSSVGVSGCQVDNSSKLLLGGLVTHPRCKIDLFQRPFATVPYLGRGSVDPILESQMQQGESITNKRSVTRLPEKTYMQYTTIPLLPDIKKRMNNPAYSIESVASEGWVRGGIPSRELTRDREYMNQNN